MSPYEISICLWYYTSPRDWEGMDAPIWRKTVNRLIDLGLLQESSRHESMYEGTEKLKAYIAGLCDMPMPEQVWIIPKYSK